MAEIAGLTLGVVALAGVFGDCLDIMSQISAIRSMGSDAEILNTKLDVEKTLFLQWAERTQLLQPDRAPELRNIATAQAVERILDTMHGILKNSSEIQSRYGLRERHPMEPVAAGSATISGRRMMRFIKDFDRLNIQGRQQKGLASSLSAPIAGIRWIAVDKEKFERLIQDLSYFVEKLNELVPPAGNSLSLMAADDLKDHDANMNILRRVLSLNFQQTLGLESHLLNAAKGNFEELCRKRILRTLWFRSADERREYIHPAHSKTLDWALSPLETNHVEVGLSEWFRSGSGIYWVSGKAGSGKSTLMKHLFDHPSTKELLNEWSGGSPMISGCFFFWYLGTALQRSYEGLTRTLLHHICQKDPFLIPKVLPEMWTEALGATLDRSLNLPTPAETKLAFNKLSQIPINFCLFIDGLDEFSGANQEGISFVESLGQAPNIKVIVSSRPEPDFVAAFSAKPALRMEALTRADIEKYVQDTLTSNAYMNALLSRKVSQTQTRQMLWELVEKADGIFLWIVLACRSILTGCAMKDRLHELELRVAELPKEIGDMFAYMLSKVDKKYQLQCAKYLRICHEVFTKSEERHIPTVGFSILDESHDDLMGCSRLENLSIEDMEHYCTTLAGRLNSRCGGLLELRFKKTAFSSAQTWSFAGEASSYDPIVDTDIVFIHRTVVDFFNSEASWDMEYLKIPDGLFYSRIALSCLWMSMAQCNRHSTLVDTCIVRSLSYLYDACEDSPSLSNQLLSSFQDILQSIRPYLTTPLVGDRSCCPDITALIVAVELGIVEYVKHFQRIHQQSLSSALSQFPLLYHALSQPFLNSLSGTLPVSRILRSAEMVRHLLSCGCSANEEFPDVKSRNLTTPWNIWTEGMKSNADRLLGAKTKCQITEAILDSGVDTSSFPLRYDELFPVWESQLAAFPSPPHMSEQEEVDTRKKGREILHRLFGRQRSSEGPSRRIDKRQRVT